MTEAQNSRGLGRKKEGSLVLQHNTDLFFFPSNECLHFIDAIISDYPSSPNSKLYIDLHGSKKTETSNLKQLYPSTVAPQI